MPTERNARHNYLQILLNLQNYKEEAFTKVETWNVLAKKLAKILEIVRIFGLLLSLSLFVNKVKLVNTNKMSVLENLLHYHQSSSIISY